MFHVEIHSLVISINTKLCLCKYISSQNRTSFSICMKCDGRRYCHMTTCIEDEHVESEEIPEFRIVREIHEPSSFTGILRHDSLRVRTHDFRSRCIYEISRGTKISPNFIWVIPDFYEKLFQFETEVFDMIRSSIVIDS